MDVLGEMLPWEIEGQDIIDGATVGMFDAGADKDPEESRVTFLGLCWPTPTPGSQAKGLPEQSAAVGGAVPPAGSCGCDPAAHTPHTLPSELNCP